MDVQNPAALVYAVDEPIFSKGDPANAVFYIQSGKVRLTVQSVDGERAVLSILSKGSFFGECCLAGQPVRSATASALLPSTIVRIEKQATLDLLHSDPEFAEQFRTYMLFRSISMEADLVSHLLRVQRKTPGSNAGDDDQVPYRMEAHPSYRPDEPGVPGRRSSAQPVPTSAACSTISANSASSIPAAAKCVCMAH